MNKFYLFFFILITSVNLIQAQSSKLYFDKSGVSSTDTLAYYYRVNINDTSYKSFYMSNGNIYFEGKISNASVSDENTNVYYGKCLWYYKNGKKKTEKHFNKEGIVEGKLYEYYENGKIKKEQEYINGRIKDNKYIEYTFDGQVNRIMKDDFSNNTNDWDLYVSDKSISKIQNNHLTISSLTKSGTARNIYYDFISNTYSIEAKIDVLKAKNAKSGILWGFKDWDNYNYFLISGNYIYIGSVFEGINSIIIDDMYSSDIKGKNLIKLLSTGDNLVFSINGNIQFKGQSMRNYGSKIGFGISGKNSITISDFVIKQIGFKSSMTSNSDMNVKATGTGLIISKYGYVVTNYHVVEENNFIQILVSENGISKTYNAKVEIKDVDNDLVILKIQDENFETLPIEYSINSNISIDVGESVFTIGYPHALGGMGLEAKFNDGRISAKTGFDGNINSFQTSIPVQPGNSGGPVFNNNGELIGIIYAKFNSGDNVSYAIKLSYLKILLDLLPQTVNSGSINNLSLEDKIKAIKKHVVLIKVK